MNKYYCPICGEKLEEKKDIYTRKENFYCMKCKFTGSMKWLNKNFTYKGERRRQK